MQEVTLPLKTDFGWVRRACGDDASRVVQMAETLAAHHGDQATLTVENLIRDMSGDPPWLYVLVAQADDELVGYAALCPRVQLQFGMRGLDMHHLFTEARLRGRGIGQGLIEASKITARALGCSYMTVGTHPDNAKAQAFYARLGFKRADAHPPRFSIQL